MKKYLPAAGLLLAGLLANTTEAQAQTPAFIRWPLKRGTTDSTAQRSANITPGTTRFAHFVVSSGQPVTIATGSTMAYIPYSSAYGQAFGWNASGGGWSSSATPAGPGSTVRRGNYEEFSFTANGAVQVDSLIFTCSVLSSTNGVAALTYSRTGFATDSAEFTGGKGPTSTSTAVTVLPATANGTFTGAGLMPSNAAAANKITLPGYDATVSAYNRTFRMAYNGATGVALVAGNRFTTRLHFGVSTTSEGRYVVLKDVIIKSKQAVLATRAAVATNLEVYPNPATDQLAIPHAAAGRAAQVLVYNATGARVLTQAAQPGSLETAVRLGSLANGLYLVEYADGDTRSTARIVKN